MPVSREDVEHVARLARLGLAPDEVSRLRGELESILGYIAQLDSLDTTGVTGTAHVIELPTPLREDRTSNPEAAEEMVRGAPDRDRTYLRVPKIID